MNLQEPHPNGVHCPPGQTLVGALEASGHIREVAGGACLIAQGDPSDEVYLIVAGRLDVSKAGPDGGTVWLGQLVAGDIVGEMGILLGQPRSATVRAVRDCVVKALRADEFRQLMGQPAFGLAVARTMASRVAASGVRPDLSHPFPKNLTLLPLDPDRRVLAFPGALEAALIRLGLRVERVSRERERGKKSFEGRVQWLSELERRVDVVLLEARLDDPEWTSFCVRQADRLIRVAHASSPRGLRAVEAHLPTSRHQQLVLLQSEDATRAWGTAAWLDARPPMTHHHVRPGCASDEDRVARLLTDRGMGLALGGGGVRAPLHIGVLRALLELGVPVDCISGTSSGSAVAAGFAAGFSLDSIRSLAREMTRAAVPRLGRLQPPFTSLTSGRALEGLLERVGAGRLSEDQFISSRIAAYDLKSRELVHLSRGPLWLAIRASSSVPGIFPPVALDGRLLIDGGVADNLPLRTLAPMCRGGALIASDLGQRRKRHPPKIEDMPTRATASVPSGWEQLWSRLIPGRTPIRAPSLPGILQASMMVRSFEEQASIDALAQRHRVHIVHHPAGRGVFGTELSVEALEERGYEATMRAFETGAPTHVTR